MLMLHLGTHEKIKEDLVIETFGFDTVISARLLISVYLISNLCNKMKYKCINHTIIYSLDNHWNNYARIGVTGNVEII